MMRTVLISTYDLGRQPFGLASPAAWLRRAGADVTCLDLAVEPLDERAVRSADLIAFYLPMHTATRLATRVTEQVKRVNASARLCFYGLYASMNEPYLRRLGADYVLGGEFESGLLSLVERLSASPGALVPQLEPPVSLDRQQFVRPDRTDLAPLSSYVHLHDAAGRIRTVGYTEASRGCKHLCRHCPVVPVYRGRFRIVQRDVVLEDIRQQVAAGAEHITFGDPDFFNGIGHAVPLIQSLHEQHPDLTYDVTVKIEHLLQHRRHLATLRETGCLFVTSAVESIDDRVLEILDKRHTRADFIEVVGLCREAGLVLNPTFVAFHPWITIEGYRELLGLLAELDLVDRVAPIQLAIRLLIPAGSRLLELPEVQRLVEPFDEAALIFPWRHRDAEVDRLQREVQALVRAAAARGESRWESFALVWRYAAGARPAPKRSIPAPKPPPGRAPIPYLTEPWYC